VNYFHYDPDWLGGVPRNEPPYSYEFVKDLRYISLDMELFKKKFPVWKNRLKNSFISENKVIYQIQSNGNLIKVYQISFESTSEKTEDFLIWLGENLIVP